MQWAEIRQTHPQQWLLVEAVEAHTEADRRVLDDIAVINTFPDSKSALESYREFRRRFPERELLVLHTEREVLEIGVRYRLGLRGRP
jgi:hypothetical protein